MNDQSDMVRFAERGMVELAEQMFGSINTYNAFVRIVNANEIVWFLESNSRIKGVGESFTLGGMLPRTNNFYKKMEDAIEEAFENMLKTKAGWEKERSKEYDELVDEYKKLKQGAVA